MYSRFKTRRDPIQMSKISKKEIKQLMKSANSQLPRNQKSKKKQSVVIVSKKKIKQHSHKNQLLSVTRQKFKDKEYTAALVDPVNSLARGARVPDIFAVPTDTFSSTGTVTLACDTSGDADFVWIGRPLHACAASSTAYIASSAFTPYAASTKCQYASTETTLQGVVSGYRMVGNGVRVKNLQPGQSATGKLIVARVPMSKLFFNPDMLKNDSISFATMLPKLCGIAVDGAGKVPISIIELPDAQEYEVQELAGCHANLANMPCSGKAWDFCTTNTNMTTATGSQSLENVDIVSASGVVTTANNDSIDSASTDGWTCILMRFVGGPTSVTNVLDIDTSIHIEGIPIISTSSTGIVSFVPDCKPEPPAKASGMREKALAIAQNIPFGEIVRGIGRTAGRDMISAIAQGLAALI